MGFQVTLQQSALEIKSNEVQVGEGDDSDLMAQEDLNQQELCYSGESRQIALYGKI